MSSISSVAPTASPAKSFESFGDFLRNDPATKNLIEKGIGSGSVCSINLSDLPLDIELDVQPSANETATVSTRKVK